MRTLAEAIFRIEAERADWNFAPVAELEIALAEDDQTVILYYKLGENWFAAGFDLPATVEQQCFDAAFYLAAAQQMLSGVKH